MFKALAIMLTVLVVPGATLCRAQAPAASVPGRPAFMPPVKSPDVAPDGRVTFRLRAPEVTEVSITGEFMRGSRSMAKDQAGVWTFTTEPLPPEIYGYNFNIDGVKTIDPGNADVKTGSTAGTIQSLLEVPASTPAFYDVRPVPHGEIRSEWYQSSSLHSTRRLTVYTPPGFDPSGRTRYPVLYLLHGANADETAWTRRGHVNLILDNLLAEGKCKPFLVVMPFGYGTPPGSEPFTGSFDSIAQSFSKDLLGDVIPYIEKNFPAFRDRDHRALAGLSMGGVESLTIGLNHLELFSYVGGLSAAIRPADFSKDFGAFTADPAADNAKLHLLWLGVGKDDGLFGATDSFNALLDAKKITHLYRTIPGAHTWIVWRQFLQEIAPKLF